MFKGKKILGTLLAILLLTGVGMLLKSSVAQATSYKPAYASASDTKAPTGQKLRPSTDFVQADLGRFATEAEAVAAVLKAKPVLRSEPSASFTPQMCQQGEAARICAMWTVSGTTSWDLNDAHMWNPGTYSSVGFRAKFHSGSVAPWLYAASTVTRCWLDDLITDTCAHNNSNNMNGYWSNTFQVCVSAGGSKSTYTMTPFAKALSNGCASWAN